MRKPVVFMTQSDCNFSADDESSAQVGDLRLTVDFSGGNVALKWLGPDGWKHLEEIQKVTGFGAPPKAASA